MSSMLSVLRRAAPRPVKTALKSLMLGTSWYRGLPPLVGRGTVQDLYYWVSDGVTETNVLLNNFYSVFFPALETATKGSLTVNDPRGRRVAATTVAVGHLECIKLTLSQVLRDSVGPQGGTPQFGSLLISLTIPPAVLDELAGVEGAFYFWHRFYIEYVTARSQPAFVHCVDKALILRHGHHRPLRWYPRPRRRDWAPEMPLNIEEYRRLYVILMNRTSRASTVALVVEDSGGLSREASATIPPNGVHRFELNRSVLKGLSPRALRMRVSGLPTTWARPVLFKEFENGAISVMHC